MSAHWVIDRCHRAAASQRGTATAYPGRLHLRIFAVPSRPLHALSVCRQSRSVARPDDDPRLRPRRGRTRRRDHRWVLAATQIKQAISRAGALAWATGGPPPTGARHLSDLPAKRGRGAAFARGRAASPRGWSQARPGARRVVVKARYVPMRTGSRAAAVHLRYLQRDRVTRDGPPPNATPPRRTARTATPFSTDQRATRVSSA